MGLLCNAFDDKLLPQDTTHQVIEQCHSQMG